jgi:hypothetical protein
LRSFIGPLLRGGGGGVSSFLRDDPEVVALSPLLPDCEGVKVDAESKVDFLETAREEPDREVDSVLGGDIGA